MNDHDKMIEVIAAHRDKKDIQIREIGKPGWGDYSTEFKRQTLRELIRDLDTSVFEFRLKPEPRRGFFPETFRFGSHREAQQAFPQAEIIEFVEVVQ